MSKNLIKIAKVNFAGTTNKKYLKTATTTSERSVKYPNIHPHTHTHTQQDKKPKKPKLYNFLLLLLNYIQIHILTFSCAHTYTY